MRCFGGIRTVDKAEGGSHSRSTFGVADSAGGKRVAAEHSRIDLRRDGSLIQTSDRTIWHRNRPWCPKLEPGSSTGVAVRLPAGPSNESSKHAGETDATQKVFKNALSALCFIRMLWHHCACLLGRPSERRPSSG